VERIMRFIYRWKSVEALVFLLLTARFTGWNVQHCFAEEGLVGYWRFDKESAEIEDLSGNGHTALVTGGRLVDDRGKKVLEFDGTGKIEIPSARDLCIRKKFTIEAMVKFMGTPDGMGIVFKKDEYLLRTDWTGEGGKISFFVFANGGWEPRVSAYHPQENVWYHIIAMWDGTQSSLWVNGEVFATARGGSTKPTDNPLMLCTNVGFGGPFTGRVEYVKIYKRILTGKEIVCKSYGIEEGIKGKIEVPVFDFSKGLQGWEARGDAQVSISGSSMLVKTGALRSYAINTELNANVDTKDYLSIRMAVDRGSSADLIFATTKGASRISFQVYPDSKMHTYVFEPWTWTGWGGELVALGIVPSEIENAVARIEYIRVTENLQADPEVQIERLLHESVLPRTERAETIVAKIRNTGGVVSNLKATLKVPEGVILKSPATQIVSSLGYLEQKELNWQVEALKPVSAEFKVEISGEKTEVSLSNTLTFLLNPHLKKASYVPEPKPVRSGKYQIWTHYCPLWKHGTHTGWKAIEPWPERKPVLGWYNEGTPEVADWHIKYWLEHGISAVIYCWYRVNINAPVQQQLGHAIHDGLLKAKYLPLIKFAIMWENGCGAGAGSARDIMENLLPFWIENYFSHPSYLRVEGKPVLYIWVPENVTRDVGGSENVRKVFEEMRQECRNRGLGGLYIVGCVGSKSEQHLRRMAEEGWDASSAYGNSWWYPAVIQRCGDFICAPYEGFVDQQEEILKFKNELNALPDITAVMMGWDSRPWKETQFFWSENTPEKFRELCMRAKKIMDSKTSSGPEKNTIIFCCWNEFGEGHYIEPTRGYGFSYLDVIREVFTDAPKEHMDIAPEDVGLGPYDSWYQEAKKIAPLAGVSTDTVWQGEKLGVWTGMMGLKDVAVKDGILTAVSTSADPAFSSPELKVRANRYSKIIVDMRVSKGGPCQIFWTTSEMPRHNEPASAHATTKADGEFHEVVFNVGKNEWWGGCLTNLRFDPAAAEGVKIEIRSIRLE